MNLSHRIAGPLAILAVLVLALAGWGFWQLSAGPEDGAADRRAFAVAGRLEAARGAQRMASRLALAASASVRGPEERSARDAGGRNALLHDSVATVLAEVDAIRTLATGQPYEPAVDRLAAELMRWRDLVEPVGNPAIAGQRGLAGAREMLASQSRLTEQLSDSIAERLVRAQAERAGTDRDAALRISGAAFAFILCAALALGAASLRFARRLGRDMARLPADLQGFARGDRPIALAGESREDELGAMVRDLRAFAERMRLLTQSRAEMERMALTDPLTGLPNRRGMYDFLAEAGRQVGFGEHGTFAVLHIDLDHFKAINDTYGHDAGDLVLREATRRMTSVIRDTDILARLGGDEFVIVARGLTGHGSLQRLAERVIRQFDAPMAFRDGTLQVSASVGAVLGGRRGEVPDSGRLLIDADIALGHAKAAGRNRWSVFTSAMARDTRRQQEQADEIREAIDRDEFRVWFRPVIDVRSGLVTALDLVPRWRHPDRGVLRVGDFIDAAEAHNLTGAVFMPAIEQALTRIAAWRAAGTPVPTLHIGMTRTMLLAPDIVDRFSWLLDECHIEPERVAIEISERFCSGRSVEAVFANLSRFADLGAGIVIDDFGSVDAALGTITRLGAATIKLNVGQTGGLVPRDGEHPVTGGNGWALLPGILGIGESLGVTVLAKGITEVAEIDRLRARGFSVMQGDAVAPALDAAATVRWLAAATPAPALTPAPGPVRLAAG